MDFPRTIAGRPFDSAPAFAQAVQADALAGGSTVVEGARPSTWLPACLEAGELDRAFVVALCAALVKGRQPAAVAEAAAVAEVCTLTELAPVFAAAVAGLDIGVLLFPDPFVEDGSIEDALLRSWAAVETEAGDRSEALLDRLRDAGLRGIELRTLVRLGTAESIRRRLPQILAEELPVEDAGALASGLGRSDEIATAICDGAEALNAAQRYAIWRVAVGENPGLSDNSEVQARWLATESQIADEAVH